MLADLWHANLLIYVRYAKGFEGTHYHQRRNPVYPANKWSNLTNEVNGNVLALLRPSNDTALRTTIG